MPSERACSAAVAFGAALVWSWITGPHAPLWPPQFPVTMAGLWVVDALAGIPLGDPIARVATAATIAGAFAAGGTAWLIARLGYPWPVAIGCSLALALSPSSWRQSVGDAPGALAATLIVCAAMVAYLDRGSARERSVVAALTVMVAGALSLPVLAAAPLVITRAATPSWRIQVVATLGGVAIALVLAAASPSPSSVGLFPATLALVRNEWLLVGTTLLVCGALTPLWGTPLLMPALGGTLVMACLFVMGQNIAPLAVFPAMLMAHALGTLPGVGVRTRIALAIMLVLLPAVYRWQSPAPDSWRLVAWRDAVERAVPRGTRMATRVREVAALEGPLFAGRASEIHLVYSPSPDVASASYVLDARVALEVGGVRIQPVPLTFSGALDLLRRLPPGTFVGVGISKAAASADPAAVAAALGALGYSAADLTHAVTGVGIIGSSAGHPQFGPSEHTHVLVGERVDESGRRSPADFDVTASDMHASVRLSGRELAAGSGWAVIAIGARGPLIGAYVADGVRAAWPIEVPGLDVWRIPQLAFRFSDGSQEGPMRTVTYGGAVSLDGFLAGVDGAIDWLHFSNDVQEVMTDYWKDVDTILMGRKTFAVAQANAPKPERRSARAKTRPADAPAIRTSVFSRTMRAIDQPGVELVSRDAAAFVRDLKQRPGKRICLMGGGELAQSLLAADLVDEIGLNIHPILLGAGVPVFRDAGHRVKLTLTECRQVGGGCILASYTVKHGA